MTAATLPMDLPHRREADIQADILIAVTQLPGALFYPQRRGLATPIGGTHAIQFGVDGMADLGGCYRGRAVQIEVKSRKGRQRQSQVRFQAAWERAGGVYIVARSVEQALAGLDATRVDAVLAAARHSAPAPAGLSLDVFSSIVGPR